MRNGYHDSDRDRGYMRAQQHKARPRVKAAETPVVDPALVFVGVLSLLAAVFLSLQSF